MEQTLLTPGTKLFLNYLNRSRTRISHTVSVLVRDPGAPDLKMTNVSQQVAEALKRPWNPQQNAVIVKKLEQSDIGVVLASDLGRALYLDDGAFTWEWL